MDRLYVNRDLIRDNWISSSNLRQCAYSFCIVWQSDINITRLPTSLNNVSLIVVEHRSEAWRLNCVRTASKERTEQIWRAIWIYEFIFKQILTLEGQLIRVTSNLAELEIDGICIGCSHTVLIYIGCGQGNSVREFCIIASLRDIHQYFTRNSTKDSLAVVSDRETSACKLYLWRRMFYDRSDNGCVYI